MHQCRRAGSPHGEQLSTGGPEEQDGSGGLWFNQFLVGRKKICIVQRVNFIFQHHSLDQI